MSKKNDIKKQIKKKYIMETKVLLEDYLQNPTEHGYGCLTRKLAEVLNGKHYTKDHAEMEVSQMHSTDANGKVYSGAHWTMEQVEAATAGLKFPEGTTICDKYVAYNTTWHDLHKVFTDEQILKAAYLIWFADEDSHSEGKIWDYMGIK